MSYDPDEDDVVVAILFFWFLLIGFPILAAICDHWYYK